jgi:hypothetical protein
VRLVARVVGTSTRPVEVRTDAGDAYIKVMGNPRGEHVLVADYVGTRVAALLGLPTFDVALLRLEGCDEIDLGGGSRAAPGPAFATRAVAGRAWGGGDDELDRVVNAEDAALLVVADTLLRNPDRHPRIPPFPGAAPRGKHADNVFLSFEGLADGRSRLIAMDFTECMTSGGEITPRVAHLEVVRDDGIYGLFDEFRPLMTRERIERAVARLRLVTREAVVSIVQDVPNEWQLSPEAREAVVSLISTRAAWLADTMAARLTSLCHPQRELFDAPDPRPEDDT